ncbi:MAG: tRNA 2-thiouridine(34) synthase MnmA [Zetaproteobacteria bacterium]|nr:tRNA 2-thiouridine(34) synthase MnmA [Zetaproteobacteria bacterium]
MSHLPTDIEALIPDVSAWRGRRVIAAMSGGVDSSVMAALLKHAGVEIIGVFLNVWDYTREEVTRHGSCCAIEDAYDARRVADLLEIPFYSMDMQEAFREHVVQPFIDDYELGRTPNPCERCNRFLKFGALLQAADALGADFVATGHYVQRTDDADGFHIYKGFDPKKDQTYFLATTTREQMARILFPVGHLEKEQTRKLAEYFQLPTASKHESQDICFIPNGDRVEFLKREGAQLGFREGPIQDKQGNLLGTHPGVAHYTLGQRKGLGLADGPWHVVELDAKNAAVIVARNDEMGVSQVIVEDLSWLADVHDHPDLSVKLRYQSQPSSCTIEPLDQGLWQVKLQTAQKPTAPGQVAAFYIGDALVGGGIVQRVAS